MRTRFSLSLALLATLSMDLACGGLSKSDQNNDGGASSTSGDGDGDADGDGDGDRKGDGDGDGGRDGDGNRVCDPGSTLPCSGIESGALCDGVQICEDDGSRWGACDCPDLGAAGGRGGQGTGGTGTGGDGTGGDNLGGGPSNLPEASCDDVVSCGGDVTGIWTVSSSCLALSGMLNLRSFGLGCDESPASGELGVTGIISFEQGGRMVDATRTTGTVIIELADSCLDVSDTRVACDQVGGPLRSLGFDKVDCQDATAGGCDCVGSFNQYAGMGHLTFDAMGTSSYSVSGDTLTISNDLTYDYCVQDEILTLTPTNQQSFEKIGGTIVLGKAP